MVKDVSKVQGNTLKEVNIRFDYENVFQISPEILREIDYKLRTNGYRIKYSKLTEEDFVQLDSVLSENSVPYEYLKDINSYNFISEDNGIVIKLNQLFCEISQDVSIEKYTSFNELYEVIQSLVKILKEKLNVHLTRIGVRKIDEIFFKDFNNFNKYFKDELLEFALWDTYITESKVYQSFCIDNKEINLIRLLDRGILNGEELYRLYLVYDVYNIKTELLNNNFDECIFEINKLADKLFYDSITEETRRCFNENIRIGDGY